MPSRPWAHRCGPTAPAPSSPAPMVAPSNDLGLTPSEQRVAELAASGMTTRDVAAALFISPKTVETNLARIYRKLGIKSRAELGRVIGDGGRAHPPYEFAGDVAPKGSVRCARFLALAHVGGGTALRSAGQPIDAGQECRRVKTQSSAVFLHYSAHTIPLVGTLVAKHRHDGFCDNQ